MVVEYEPLDLDRWRSPSPEDAGPAGGRHRLRGIPFDLGPAAGGTRWVRLAARPEPLTIPVPDGVRTLVVAHGLLDAEVLAGRAGQPVAEYLLHLADGTVITVPIREPFEIAAIPGGGAPADDPAGRRLERTSLLAVPDQYDRLWPRGGGPWELSGRQQMESDPVGYETGFKLWVWRVPDGASLVRIEIRPTRRPVVIGGMTVGYLDEHPFVRAGREPVLVHLPEGYEVSSSLALRVDRGVSTYPWACAPERADEFLAAEVHGWGEPPVEPVRTLSAEVAAVASATIEVVDGDRVLGAVRWRDVVGPGDGEGEAGDGRIRVRWVDRARTWVHTTVVDEATGSPVPCRVHFRSPSGIPWQPHGHHARVNADRPSWHIDVGGDVRLGRVTYAVIDGRCQGWLPEGEVHVEIVRGFEYEPLRTVVTIAPGQRELRLAIRRWTDLRADGWMSGDTHVHFLSPTGAHLEAAAEDLHVVNLLQAQWGHLFTNTEDFTGQPSIGPTGETIVSVGQENRQHLLGHLGLLGLRRPVMPWSSDGPAEGEIGGGLETTLSRWADEGREAGALVTVPHFGFPPGELPALVATGRVDALEMAMQGQYFHEEYYRFLNAGYRLPLVGGTDKMSSEVPVGLYRTYARIAPDTPFSYEAWADAVRAGRTFLSAGPIVRLSVEGREVGDTVPLPPGGGTVEIEAVAESAAPIHTLQVVMAGEVVAEASSAEGARRLGVRERIRVDGSTWLAARAGGPHYYDGRRALDAWRRGVFAHTSPVYVACGAGEWRREDRAVLDYMVTRIHGAIGYIRETAVIERLGGGGRLHDRSDHRGWLEEPFHEALAAIEARLHAAG
jgi:hypothetical protein